MRHPSRIKVSDLLLHIGQEDLLSIKHFSLPLMGNIDADGISGKIHLQSIDNATIIVTLENISCTIDDLSDVSGLHYKRPVCVDTFMAYFVMPSHDFILSEQDDSPIFSIDEKNETIDIAEMLYQSIVLQEPFVKRTPEELALVEGALDDDEDYFDSSTIGGTITFRK